MDHLRRACGTHRVLPLFLLFLACLLLLAAVPGADAHAALVGAEPPRNSQLDEAPDELVLHFSESFEDRYTRVQVTDDAEERYDLDNLFEDDNTRIRVPLAPMPDGIYTVHWRTLGTDTHTLSGVYFLAVNVTFDEAELPPATAGRGQGLPEEGFGAEVAVRSIGFLAGSLAAGISFFVLVLPRGDPLDAARRVHHLATTIAGGVAALAALLLLLLIARRIDGTLLEAAATDSGTWIVLRGLAFLAAGLTAWLTAKWTGNIRRDDALAALFGLGGLVATTMSSHAAAESTLRGLAIGADILHLIAVAFWLGGLALLAILVVRRVEGPVLHAAVKRFSPLAILAVVTIVVTGGLASALRILGPEDLTTTVYGRALLLKILLLVPLVGLGAFNRYFVQPRLALADATRATRRLRQTTLAEMAIMVVTLVAAGTLATVAPPDVLAETDGETDAGVDPRGILTTFEASGWSFTVRVLPEPLRVGPQTVEVTAERTGDTRAEVHDVFLILRAPDEGPSAEGHPERLERIDEDTWRLSGPIMPSRGVWHNDILVQGRSLYHTEHVPMFVE